MSTQNKIYIVIAIVVLFILFSLLKTIKLIFILAVIGLIGYGVFKFRDKLKTIKKKKD